MVGSIEVPSKLYKKYLRETNDSWEKTSPNSELDYDTSTILKNEDYITMDSEYDIDDQEIDSNLIPADQEIDDDYYFDDIEIDSYTSLERFLEEIVYYNRTRSSAFDFLDSAQSSYWKVKNATSGAISTGKNLAENGKGASQTAPAYWTLQQWLITGGVLLVSYILIVCMFKKFLCCC